MNYKTNDMKIPDGYIDHGRAAPVVIVNLLMSKFIKLPDAASRSERGRPVEVKIVTPPKPSYLLYYKSGIVWTPEELLKKPLIDLINMGEIEYYFYPTQPQI